MVKGTARTVNSLLVSKNNRDLSRLKINFGFEKGVYLTMRKKTFSESRFPTFLFTSGASKLSLVSVKVSELVELALIASSFLIVGKKAW